MRALHSLSLSALLLAGCAGHHDELGPAGIPYACADGKAARIFYEGGGYFPRARARLLYDSRTIEMQATPPTYGLRYVSDAGGDNDPILIWSVRGEEAWLSELAPEQAEERELAHCTRQRAGGVPAEPEPEHH